MGQLAPSKMGQRHVVKNVVKATEAMFCPETEESFEWWSEEITVEAQNHIFVS